MKLREIVESHHMQIFIIAIILLDSLALGIMSIKDFAYRGVFERVDLGCMYFFIVEMCVKIIAFRWEFFKSKWNLFDLIIITLSALPLGGNFLIIRLLRIFKILRLFSVIPQLRFVIAVISKTLPSVLSIGFVLIIIYYIYGILGVQLFAQVAPQHFGSLSGSLFTLFQIMTGDDWGNLARAVGEVYPYSWIFFVSFIVIVSFIILQMVVGIIVDSINEIKSNR